MPKGTGRWLDVDRDEAEEALRKRKVHSDDDLIRLSYLEKMRSKSVPWEHREKAGQFAISVTGSARAGHGHFTGRPIPDLTIGDTFRSLHNTSPRLGVFAGASTPDEAIATVRAERQQHVDWFVEHLEHVLGSAPDSVEYQVLGSDKSIFGLTAHKILNGKSNASMHHPHITSTFEQFVIAAKLFSDMDRYDHRSDVRERFRNTFADRPFEIGGGDCYLVDVPAMRRYGRSLSALEQGEHRPTDVQALAERGIIVNHENTPDQTRRTSALPNDEWVYVRAKRAPGSSDGLAFTLAGYLGGWGMAAAGRHFDNLDTWIKWSRDYEHGELDGLIADLLSNSHPRVRETLERFHADELSDVFTYLIAQDNGPNGAVFRQSTGMVPHYRRFQEYSEAREILVPLKNGASPDSGPGFDSHYRLQLPIAAENLARIGQGFPANSAMPTDWKYVSSKELGKEFEARLQAVEEVGFPAPIDPVVMSWIRGDDRRMIRHGRYRDNMVMSRHTMPFDLTPLGGSYE